MLNNSISYVLIATLIIGLGSYGNQRQEVILADSNSSSRSIQVSGEGIIKVKPDIAYVTLGVQTKHQNAQQAQTENTTKMNEVLKTLKQLGIDEKDIQTSQYSVYPEYRYIEKTGERKEDGYIVNHLLQVTIRDITKIGKVLDSTLTQGVNVSHDIQFGISKEEEYYQEALKAAMKNAQGKAEAIGQTMSVKIGKPSNIIEQGRGGPMIKYMERNEMAVTANDSSTLIETGELDVRATVQVTYQY